MGGGAGKAGRPGRRTHRGRGVEGRARSEAGARVGRVILRHQGLLGAGQVAETKGQKD